MLRDKTILVTGAARGLGYAIAKTCAAGGARIVVADRLADLGQCTVDTLRSAGANARFVAVDLADPNSITAMAHDIGAQEGRLDGLVNNAAIATNVGGIMFDAIDIDRFDQVMQINIRGTWLVTRAIAPLLVDGGAIVNVASDTALWGAPRLLAYVASKGAVIAMTRSLARELGERRITVTAVAPGIVRTEATDYVPEARHRLYEEQRAIQGPQLPEDVAGVVAFLLTPAALPLTGQVLAANAGFVFA